MSDDTHLVCNHRSKGGPACSRSQKTIRMLIVHREWSDPHRLLRNPSTIAAVAASDKVVHKNHWR
jgi:hypothetical protein